MNTEYHRRRLTNLRDANDAVSSCMAEHRIGEYLAGQVIYNLGEYPLPFSIAPTEYDEALLQQFADHGVGLIQLHEEWNDSQRVLGADKFSSHDEPGLARFIELVHSLGMKIILYASTGFFEATDPDFDPAWAHPDAHLIELWYDYARCSPASPGWRAYLLPHLERIMDEYGIDGLYDDAGYYPVHLYDAPLPDDISPGPETPQCHSAFYDLLEIVSDMVHKRGGVFKVHVSGAESRGLTNDIYDYLWVGEGIESIHELRAKTKAYDPYVVPALDMSRAHIDSQDDLYRHSVPYMQFPMRWDGRPVTGERAFADNVTFRRGEDCFWTRNTRAMHKYYIEHPEARPIYDWWGGRPGPPDARERWFHHFDLYRPMVAEGTRVWIDITATTIFDQPLPEAVTASLFVNDTMYLVLANYTDSSVTLNSPWTWQNRETGQVSQSVQLLPQALLYLQRIEPG